MMKFFFTILFSVLIATVSMNVQTSEKSKDSLGGIVLLKKITDALIEFLQNRVMKIGKALAGVNDFTVHRARA
ncbi:hypothetical protein [Chryseobacterium lathyri]|uniref:Uncharacterized protein n=1 Tax=Chryseobacterium lathyri TaxID=395933 RepID=A0ABT9SJZ3_9FLAO|nr:hypothetical protein [Chryseobacterium lathyri]MDP9959169.1 hypothetical protein [Chryseobacterium lathyri]